LDPNEKADWNVDFEISKRLEFIGNILDSNTIKFRKLDNYITGFNIIVKNTTFIYFLQVLVGSYYSFLLVVNIIHGC